MSDSVFHSLFPLHEKQAVVFARICITSARYCASALLLQLCTDFAHVCKTRRSVFFLRNTAAALVAPHMLKLESETRSEGRRRKG